MDKKTRNMLIAGTVGTLCLGPLGAAAVAWGAHHFTSDEEITAIDFSVWDGDKLVGCVNPSKIQNTLHMMKINDHLDLSQIRIGVRWSDDSVEYFTLAEAQEQFS